MSTLKVIFDFLLSVVKVIFPRKKNGRHPSPDSSLPHGDSNPGTLPEADRGGTGSHRRHPDPLESEETGETGETQETAPLATNNSPTPARLMGWALITVAIGRLLFS